MTTSRNRLPNLIAAAVADALAASPIDATHGDVADMTARIALRTAGKWLCDTIDRRLSDGERIDNGWIQGVKQAGEDLQRIANRTVTEETTR